MGSSLALGHIVEIDTIAWVLGCYNAYSCRQHIIAWQHDDGEVVVGMWRALVLIDWLPGADITKMALAYTPGLDYIA